MRLRVLAVSTFVLALSAAYATASPIATRTDLQTLLGGGGTLEDFETYFFSSSGAATLDCDPLDSLTVCNGQGPGLVVGGVSFGADLGALQWNSSAYFYSPSQELLGTSSVLLVDFTTSVNAFGVDLRTFPQSPSTTQIGVWGANDMTLLGTFTLGLSSDTIPLFWGFSDAGGIGAVRFRNTDRLWSPIIDNLEFGEAQSAPVPEPASLTLLGLGLAGMAGRRWRQRKRA